MIVEIPCRVVSGQAFGDFGRKGKKRRSYGVRPF